MLQQPRQIRGAKELGAKISSTILRRSIRRRAALPELRDLHELYIDVSLEEGPVELEPFLKRVTLGEFGEYPAPVVRDFLYDRESEMMANMQLRAGVSPGLAEGLEEKAQEIREWVEDLVKRYAT